MAGGAPTPFRPFAEALTSAGRAGRLPAERGTRPVPAGARAAHSRSGGPRSRCRGEESPVFLGEAVLRLLRALAPQAGCVLVLEDLHWADQETLALLEYLADNLAAERVLCLATLREPDMSKAAKPPRWPARSRHAGPPPCWRWAASIRRRWPT